MLFLDVTPGGAHYYGKKRTNLGTPSVWNMTPRHCTFGLRRFESLFLQNIRNLTHWRRQTYL